MELLELAFTQCRARCDGVVAVVYAKELSRNKGIRESFVTHRRKISSFSNDRIILHGSVDE